MRGTVNVNVDVTPVDRFIPARAGNRGRVRSAVVVTAVHPRSCGEQTRHCMTSYDVPGSSPLVRGTDHRSNGTTKGRRFIPARAGNSFGVGSCFKQIPVHPRSCGEQLTLSLMHSRISGSSPLVRGTVVNQPDVRTRGRFIPARAGNRNKDWADDIIPSVHPRSCGEQPAPLRY